MTHAVYSSQALKRAAWQFLTGKILSAVLTFTILIWLIRLLPLSDYGVYAVLIASAELGYAIAGLGIPWLTARFLPEYRMNSSGTCLSKLCSRLFYWELLALICLAVLLAALLDAYLQWSGLMAYRTAAWLALGLLVAEGIARFQREALLSPLLLQGEVRTSFVLRQTIFLAVIATLDFTGQESLNAVLAAECVAALLSALATHILLKAQKRRPCLGFFAPYMGKSRSIFRRRFYFQSFGRS